MMIIGNRLVTIGFYKLKLLIHVFILNLCFISGQIFANETLISIKLESHIGNVNRNIFGSNALAYQFSEKKYSDQGAGIWDPDNNRSVPEMVTLAKNVGISTLRWPGGCGAHEYNWKLTVGAKLNRKNQLFGLSEYMSFVNEIGAKPIITLADFWGNSDDAADLVEYLNSPVGENINGGIDWAKIRESDGHPEPYGVSFFEFGNETFHGPHTINWQAAEIRGLSAEEYSEKYIAYQQAMKNIDPNIKLGAVLEHNKLNGRITGWTDSVIKKTGISADYFIYHAYPYSYSRDDDKISLFDIFKVGFASAFSLQSELDILNGYILKLSGRVIPIAVTEYNGSFIQNKPVPYRMTVGNAVMVADMLQVFLNPKNNIETAQYWQFSNEYWGMISGYEKPYVLHPAYFVFKLYHEHIGDYFLESFVEGDSYAERGGYGVAPAYGNGVALQPENFIPIILQKWKINDVDGAIASQKNNGDLEVRLSAGKAVNYFHSSITIDALPLKGYRVSAEIRTKELTPVGAQIQVIDARGWDLTRYQQTTDAVISNTWRKVETDFFTLHDTEKILVVARRLQHSAENGAFWIRNVIVECCSTEYLPKIPYVSVMTTRKENNVSVFLVNRRLDAPSKVRLLLPKISSAHLWVLSGVSLDDTNITNSENVSVRELPISFSEDSFSAEVPAGAFAVFDINI